MMFRAAADNSTAPLTYVIGTKRRGNIIKLAPAERRNSS